jgi:peptidoglycan/xylan/chitin deacetylase (PgdA/CDA1 family)
MLNSARYHFIAVSLVVASGFCIVRGVAAAPELTYLEHISEATDRLRRDMPRQAEDECLAANASDYADPLGWIGLGASLLAQGYADAALENFERAYEVAAKGSQQARGAVPLARFGRAICDIQRGQVKQGRQELATLTEEGFTAAWPALAYAELAMGNRVAARKEAQSALEQSEDDPLALAVLGRLATGAEAARTINRAIQSCPGSSYVMSLSGLVLPNTSRPGGHTENPDLHVTIEDTPIRRAVLTWSGGEQGIYITLKVDGQDAGMSNTEPHQFGLPRELAPGYHGVVAQVWVDGRVLGRAGALLWSGAPGQPQNRHDNLEYTAALEGLQSVLAPVPNRVHLHYWLANNYAAANQPGQALWHYERVVAMDPDFADARKRMLELYPALGVAGSTSQVSATRGKSVCLTFDDGPSPVYTPQILDLLRAAHVRATFFVVGSQAREHPELLRAIADAGHEIANHSFSHDDMTVKSAAEIQRDLLQTQVLVQDVTRKRTRLFRPPGGKHNAATRAAAAQLGYTTVLWSANVSVCAGRSPEAGARLMLQDIGRGAIVLLHNGPDETVDVLPGLLAALKKRGYSFSTLSEALGK